MSIRERILTIRLLDKAAGDPAFAHALGIEIPGQRVFEGVCPKEERTEPQEDAYR